MIKKLLLLAIGATLSVSASAAPAVYTNQVETKAAESEINATFSGTATGNYTGVDGEPAFTITYTATWNENHTVTVNANINPIVTGLVPQMFVNNGYEGNFTDQGNGNFTYTTTATFEAGEKPLAFYLAYTGGAVNVPMDYVVGSTSEGSEDPDPDQPTDPETGATYHGTLTGNYTGVDGEPEFTITYDATWNENRTVTVNANINPTVTGLVTQMFVNNGYEGDFANQGNGNFTYTTTATFEAGEKPLAFYLAYTGGAVNVPMDYVVGSTSEGSEEPDPDQPTDPEEGNNAVWYGQTDIEGFQADWNIKFNTNRTLTFSAEMTTEKTVGVNERNVHIFGSESNQDEWVKLYDTDGSGVYVGTTTNLFTLDSKVSWEWYMPVEAGLYKQTNEYIVGSSNEAPKSIRISATVDNVTATSAEIAYEVTAPEGAEYKVYYKTADTEAVEATENPIQLVDLSEKTDYAYEIYAVMGEGDESVESRHVTVNFRTAVENARAYVFNDYVKAHFKNAYYVNEDESMRRSIYASIPFTVTYNIDETATYTIDLTDVADIVGLTPQIYWNGHRQLVKQGETDVYEFDFDNEVQVLDAKAEFSHYLAYNGGVVDINLYNERVYTAWGQEKEAFELGEPAAIALSASKEYVLVNEPTVLSSVPTDSNGYYLPADELTYKVEGNTYELKENGELRLTGVKGVSRITASLGEISKSIYITVYASPESTNVLAGKLGVTDTENIQAGSVENVTDVEEDNKDYRNTQLEWACGETQEHYLIYELDNPTYIEAINVLFEGAYATKFTVTLSNVAPGEFKTLADTNEMNDVVFENEKNDIEHYFLQNPTGTHKYVTLRTSEALNTGWGIKLRDLEVFGSEAPPTVGVEDVVVEDVNAPAEYFNLQGVRVAQPEAGNLYIVRKGNAVTKVIVR